MNWKHRPAQRRWDRPDADSDIEEAPMPHHMYPHPQSHLIAAQKMADRIHAKTHTQVLNVLSTCRRNQCKRSRLWACVDVCCQTCDPERREEWHTAHAIDIDGEDSKRQKLQTANASDIDGEDSKRQKKLQTSGLPKGVFPGKLPSGKGRIDLTKF